jgi:hypothetical protein
MMAHRTIIAQVTPRSLTEALQLTLTLAPGNQGQQIAQRDIVTALESALDARRQRIEISRSEVNSVNGCAYICRQPVRCSRSPWSIAIIGAQPLSQWDYLRPGSPRPSC